MRRYIPMTTLKRALGLAGGNTELVGEDQEGESLTVAVDRGELLDAILADRYLRRQIAARLPATKAKGRGKVLVELTEAQARALIGSAAYTLAADAEEWGMHPSTWEATKRAKYALHDALGEA